MPAVQDFGRSHSSAAVVVSAANNEGSLVLLNAWQHFFCQLKPSLYLLSFESSESVCSLTKYSNNNYSPFLFMANGNLTRGFDVTAKTGYGIICSDQSILLQ